MKENLVNAYYKRLTSKDKKTRIKLQKPGQHGKHVQVN